MARCVEFGLVARLRWLIQSPSGTGLRTGFEVGMVIVVGLITPLVDEVRGGIAFGERRFSDNMAVVGYVFVVRGGGCCS